MRKMTTDDTYQPVRTNRREIRQGRREDGLERDNTRRTARGTRVREAQRLAASAARAGVVTF